MNKYGLVILVILGLTSCSVKNEHYYQSHPKALQQAIKDCPSQVPQGLTCLQIDGIATRMNDLAHQLQYNPQGFGAKILTLQQIIPNQQMELKRNATNLKLKANIEQNKHDLVDHLLVVKWLESPES